MQYLLQKRHVFSLPTVFVLFVSIILLGGPVNVQSQKSEDASGVDNTITYLPVVQNKFDATLGIPIFGVQMYGNTSSTSTFHDALVGTDASWLRVEVSWASAEPISESPPVYQWGSIDNNLAAARADMGALNIIATVNHAPSWAAQYSTGPINSANLEDFASFTKALVERYDGDGVDDAPGSPVILYWEMYNEPDSNSIVSSPSFLPPVGWGNHGEEYAIMLEEVYPGIKIANPQAKVVFGGIAYDGYESAGGKFVESFLTDVLDAGGGNFFDVMNFHSYPAFYLRWTTNQGPGLYEKAVAIREVLADYELNVPLIVTEMGWHSNNAPGPIIPGSQQIQARYVVELFTQSMAADLDLAIWWMLYDVGNYPYDTGLVTNAGNPVEKLAFYVYQDVVAELATAHYVRKLTNAETGSNLMEVYLFNDNVFEHMVYVAWLNRVDTADVAPLRLPVSQATVKNSITGSVTAVADGNDGVNDGFITVMVGANPLFIEVDK